MKSKTNSALNNRVSDSVKVAKKWLKSSEGVKVFRENLQAAREFTSDLDSKRQIDVLKMKDAVTL